MELNGLEKNEEMKLFLMSSIYLLARSRNEQWAGADQQQRPSRLDWDKAERRNAPSSRDPVRADPITGQQQQTTATTASSSSSSSSSTTTTTTTTTTTESRIPRLVLTNSTSAPEQQEAVVDGMATGQPESCRMDRPIPPAEHSPSRANLHSPGSVKISPTSRLMQPGSYVTAKLATTPTAPPTLKTPKVRSAPCSR